MKRFFPYMIVLTVLVLRCGSKISFVRYEGHRLSWGVQDGRTHCSDEQLLPPLKQLWEYRLNASPGRSLVALDSVIVFGSRDGKIHLIDVMTGRGSQTQKDREKIENTCVVTDSSLLVAKRIGRYSLRSLDLLDWSEKWAVQAGPVEGEPLVLDDRIYVGTDESLVRCYDLSTGRLLWKRTVPGRVRGSLATNGDLIFAATDDRWICAVSAASGHPVWRSEIGGHAVAGPAVYGQSVFIGCPNEWVGAFDAESGRAIWTARTTGGIFTTPAVNGHALYVGTSQGQLYAFDIHNATILWQTGIQGVFGSSPLISGSVLYIGSLNRKIMAFDCQTGESVWEAEVRGRVRTTPVIWKGVLVVGTGGRRVYGFVPEE